MNNEPVAWMALNELNGSYSTFTNDQKQRLLPHVSQCYGKWIPLYTNPVKEPMMVLDGNRVYPAFKELTDEEIIAEAQGVKYSELSIAVNDFYILFARAILRKAQEK